MEEDLCNFGVKALFWEVAPSAGRNREFVDSHCSNKSQYSTFSKSLLGAFFSECILCVCVFCFIHVQMKTTRLFFFFYSFFFFFFRETS